MHWPPRRHSQSASAAKPYQVLLSLTLAGRLVTDNNISEVVISEVIGQGNFGTVYSGRFCDQDVAAKNWIIKIIDCTAVRKFWAAINRF